MKSNKKEKNKHYSRCIIYITYSNRLDSLTISRGVSKLSQRARRALREKGIKKLKNISVESPPIFYLGKKLKKNLLILQNLSF